MKAETLFERVLQCWLIGAIAISGVVTFIVCSPLWIAEKIYNAYNTQKQGLKEVFTAFFLFLLFCAAIIFLPILAKS
jgi:hypothetical protein